ncbi:hypothetical protein FAI40_04075 [Acetobacteraceae bacterium]|nr:hypothetical protein FAI40_04075 [Acetobacteraceae bacterium]
MLYSSNEIQNEKEFHRAEIIRLSEIEKIAENFGLWLYKSHKKPGISQQKIALEILKKWFQKSSKKRPSLDDFKSLSETIIFTLQFLKDNKTIQSLFKENHSFFQITDVTTDYPLESLLCSALPYGYLSHLTAMVYYNLTNRIPKHVYYTLPSPAKWRKKAQEDLRLSLEDLYQRDLKEIDKLPRVFKENLKNSLFQNPFPAKRENPNFIFTLQKEPLPYGTTPEGLRILPIGELFLTMLKTPEKCGGKDHVLATWAEHGSTYAKQILKTSQKRSSQIEQARIGFFLDEILHISNPVIENLRQKQEGKRGGSRKFWPDKDYSPAEKTLYSENWNLALNDPFFQDYFTSKVAS